MSYSVDANVLLYASDENNPRHQAALAFLQERPQDPDLFCLTWPTLMAYLRIATHPSIFTSPLSPAEALANIDALLQLPRVRVISESSDFLAVYTAATHGVTVRGNLVPDAHLAAILKHHGVSTLYSCDRDFRRFTFLDVRDPFSP